MLLFELLDSLDNWNMTGRINVVRDDQWIVLKEAPVVDIADDEDLKNLEVESFGFYEGVFAVRVKEDAEPEVQKYIISICSSDADGIINEVFRGTEEEVKEYLISLVEHDRENDPEDWDDEQYVSVEKTGTDGLYTYGQYLGYHIDYVARPIETLDIVTPPEKPNKLDRVNLARNAVLKFYDGLAELPKPESYNMGGTYYGSTQLISRVGNDLRIITGEYTEYGYGFNTTYYDVFACKIGGAYGYRKEEKELAEKLKNLLTDSDYYLIYDIGTNFSVIGIGTRNRKEVAS